jgi:hypothetical protein
LHLIGGTLQLTETTGANTYSGGTVVETGSTLDLTTAQVSTGNANITDAGGLIVFDMSKHAERHVQRRHQRRPGNGRWPTAVGLLGQGRQLQRQRQHEQPHAERRPDL